MPLKGKEKIDIIIVVDMLLTGFDSKYLNTLYVDKNLKHHGLIQAFSRTNRVLNGTNPYGNSFEQRLQRQQGPTISLGPPGHREVTAAELPRPTAKSATDLPLGFTFSRHIPQHAPCN